MEGERLAGPAAPADPTAADAAAAGALALLGGPITTLLPGLIEGLVEAEPDAAQAETLDRLMHAWQGRLTASLSPATLLLAYGDWLMHLMNAPGKQAMLLQKAIRKWTRLADSSSQPHGPSAYCSPATSLTGTQSTRSTFSTIAPVGGVRG